MNRRFEPFEKEMAGLALRFQVNPDSCGNSSHYELYLRFIAATDRASGRGFTYVFTEDRPNYGKDILGFVTLRASSLIRTIEGQTKGDAAIEITELAVDKHYENQGIGTRLLEYAISRAVEINEQFASVRYMLVCADPQAVPFYQKFGFALLNDYGDIPREGWNENCIPMFLGLIAE